ncbi:MAG: competence protein CoiA family protein [Nitrososphaerota archaeon]
MVSRALVNNEDYTIWGYLSPEDRARLIRAREEKQIMCRCGKPLTYVDATQVIPHFRHLQGNCLIIGAERDTISHNEGLEYLGQLLRTRLTGVNVEKEHIFRVRRGLRRTDIFVEFGEGRKICYELQLSPLSTSEFRNRTSCYEKLGNEVVWIFGPDASGISNIQTNPEGVLVPIKEAAFLSLKKQGYLLLYYPEISPDRRLWIAYCTDHKYNRTYEFLTNDGFLVEMRQVKITMVPLQFTDNGLPLISRREKKWFRNQRARNYS